MPELRIEGALNFVGRGGSCGPVGVVAFIRIYHKVMLGGRPGRNAGGGAVRLGICSERPKLSAEKNGTAEAIP